MTVGGCGYPKSSSTCRSPVPIFAAAKFPAYSASCTDEHTIGMPVECTEIGALTKSGRVVAASEVMERERAPYATGLRPREVGGIGEDAATKPSSRSNSSIVRCVAVVRTLARAQAAGRTRPSTPPIVEQIADGNL
jgi:hypothetical protein